MEEKEAREIVDSLTKKNNLSDDELNKLTDALKYYIELNNSPQDMAYLAGLYYERQQFELALKYYEMAAEMDYEPAVEKLGYYWYFGQTGKKDYEKAFKYFSKSAELGNLKSQCKVADMYKHGYFVELDYNKYVEIVKDLYNKVKDAEYMSLPLPEVFSRLAVIYRNEGENSKAIDLLLEAKDFLKQRIIYNSFWGDLNVMMWLIDDLYKIKEFDKNDFDLYDLFYLLKKPSRMSFKYNDKTFVVHSFLENERLLIEFNDKVYDKREEFFTHATIDNVLLTHLYFDLDNFELIEGK